jgi:hypothetical protein
MPRNISARRFGGSGTCNDLSILAGRFDPRGRFHNGPPHSIELRCAVHGKVPDVGQSRCEPAERAGGRLRDRRRLRIRGQGPHNGPIAGRDPAGSATSSTASVGTNSVTGGAGRAAGAGMDGGGGGGSDQAPARSFSSPRRRAFFLPSCPPNPHRRHEHHARHPMRKLPGNVRCRTDAGAVAPQNRPFDRDTLHDP